MKDVLIKTYSINIAGWEFVISADSDVINRTIEKFILCLSNTKKSGDLKKFNIYVSYRESALNQECDSRRYTVEREGSVFTIRHSDFLAIYNFEDQTGVLENYRKDIVSVDAYLRFAISYLCLIDGGVLIHSAGVLTDDGGIVFPGPSMSGKTTLCNMLYDRYLLLGEELQIVLPLKGNGGYEVYGTPFLGSSSRVSEYGGKKLKDIIFHSKSNDFFLRKIDYKDALFRLLETVIIYVDTKDIAEIAVKNSGNLLKKVRTFEMGFPLDDDWIDDFDTEVRNL
jgi:hypothetical protein